MEFKCNLCGGEMYEERHIQAVSILFDKTGEPFASENSHVRGGTKQYCAECGKDVSILIAELQANSQNN